MKNRLLTIIHILVWAGGTAFLMTGAFHGNLWFDESYTVGLMNHNLWDIIKISGADVHPPFYYVLLRLYTFVFGSSLVSLRLFSVLFASLLTGLGFTHIRRDFGERVGFWYTALMFLLAVTFKYANEIRMYTLAPYLVILAAIYAYRFYKSGMTDNKCKNLFLIFGILGAYTHYYGLAAAGAINLLLLLYCRKNDMLALWRRLAAVQLLCYLPGFYWLVTQTSRVVGDFWISMRYPDFIYDSLSFFFVGYVPEDAVALTDVTLVLYKAFALLFWGICTWAFIVYYRKHGKKTEPVMLALKTVGIIIAFYFAVSLIRPLYYVRYLTVLSGLIVFFLAFAFDKINKAFVKAALLLAVSVVLVLRVTPLYEVMYSKENDQLEAFMSKYVLESDIIISDNIGLIAVLAVKYPNMQVYFYNRDHWTVEKAYEAYMPQLETVRELTEAYKTQGRIWVLKNYYSDYICDEIAYNTGKEITAIHDTFVLPYHRLEFGFTLME